MIRRRINKKSILIIIVAILLLAIGAYAALSIMNWHQLNSRTSALPQAHKLLAQLPTSENFIKDQSSAYSTAQNIVKLDQPSCQIGKLYQWQRVIPALDKIINDCHGEQSDLHKIQLTSSKIINLIDDSTTISAIIGRLKIDDTTINPDDWTKQKNNVSAVLSDLQKADLHAESRGLSSATNKLVKDLDSEWQKLIDTDKSHDKDAYNTATTKLKTLYKNFSSLEDTLTDDYKTVIKTDS